jgi:phenylpyruvate tautomerase PptA (4-oxalocrotonate tautomerase family)
MKITVSNYASKRSELLENSNKKLVEIVEGLTTDTVEVYGLDPEIDESIDVILEQINKALDAQAKPGLHSKSEPEKPSPKEAKKISKAKSLLGISKDNKEKGKAFANSKQKKAAIKPNLHQKQTSLS